MFAPIGSHVNENEKKNGKNRRNLSRREGQTEGQTTDACATTVALLTKSSRTKILQFMFKKHNIFTTFKIIAMTVPY